MGIRGKPCSICNHEARAAIEIGLAYRVSCYALASRFNCSLDQLYVHSRSHLSPQMKASILLQQKPNQIDLEALERSESESLLSNLVHQRARLALLSEACLAAGEHNTAVSIERAITTSLELTSKLLGMIINRTDVRTVSVLLSQDYLELRRVIIGALTKHPEAARDVARALSELEEKAAKDIAESKKPVLPALEHMPA